MKRLGADHVQGPAVYLDRQSVDRYPNISVDTHQLGKNLLTDFPEVDQSEWDNTAVYLTHTLAPNFGGLAVNMLGFDSSRSARVMLKAYAGITQALSHPRYPTYREMKKISRGREVLVFINLAASALTGDGKFFDKDDLVNPSDILAHELHHAVGHIVDNRTHRNQLEAMDKSTKKFALKAGSLITGATLTGSSGLIGSVYLLDPTSPTVGKVLGGSLAGGMALTIGSIRSMKKDSKTNSTIKEPENIYGKSEDCANAYAIAMRDKWTGVIKT